MEPGRRENFGWDQAAIAVSKFADGGLKPREGHVQNGRFVCDIPAPEAEEGEIFQAISPIARTPNGDQVVFDLWLVGDEPKGMGVRELRDIGDIFVPHCFD